MNKFIPQDYKKIKQRKRLKFTKKQENKHVTLKGGTAGLKSLESSVVSADIFEVCRKIISRRIKKIGKVIFYGHPNISLTQKSSGMRMGKGKGNLSKWVYPVRKGKILIELISVPTPLATTILKAVSFKLPMKTKIILE